MMLITYDTAEAETNLMVGKDLTRSGLKEKQLYHLALLQRDNSWAEIDQRSKISFERQCQSIFSILFE